MQTPQQRIKILDFGLALAGTGVDELSATGSVVGTLGYLAPEQASNEPVDERIDLYALGVVMYEMSCGKLPFLARNVSTQLITILASDPAPLLNSNPKVPEPLAELIHVLLQKDPSDRIATAMRLHDRLVNLADEIEQSQQQQLEIVVNADDSAMTKGPLKHKAASPDRPRRSSRHPNSPDIDVRKPSKSELRDALEEEEVFELAEPGNHFSPRKWLPVLAIALLAVGLGTFWIRQPKKVAHRVSDSSLITGPRSNEAASSGPGFETKSTKPAKLISAQSLETLSIQVVPYQNPKVQSGNFVSRKLVFANDAETPQSDPRFVFRGTPKVAQIAVSLTLEGETLPNAPAFPQSFSAGRLPRRDKSIPVNITFTTKGLKVGTYELVFELQTPDGKAVSTTQMPLDIVKSSQKGH